MLSGRLFAGFSLVIVAAVLTFLWVMLSRLDRCDRVGICRILQGESKDFVNEAGIDYLLETFDPEDKYLEFGLGAERNTHLQGFVEGRKDVYDEPTLI